MNNIAPKTAKMLDTKNIALNIISKMLKQPNFFYSQPSTLPKDAPAKFYFSTTFGLSFMISSAAPARSSTFHAYLNLNLFTRLFSVIFLLLFGHWFPLLENSVQG